MGTSAMIMSTTPQRVGSGAAMGITAKVTSDGTSTRIGARTKKKRDAVAGSVSSLSRFLTPSAMGWSSPKGPTRFGPRRSWMKAEIRRSASVAYATTTITTVKMPRVLANMKKIAAPPWTGCRSMRQSPVSDTDSFTTAPRMPMSA